jgi:hypothetical protein
MEDKERNGRDLFQVISTELKSSGILMAVKIYMGGVDTSVFKVNIKAVCSSKF